MTMRAFLVTVHGAARAVFSAPREGDSPIFAAESVADWAKAPFVPRKLGQSPCERLPFLKALRTLLWGGQAGEPGRQLRVLTTAVADRRMMTMEPSERSTSMG